MWYKAKVRQVAPTGEKEYKSELVSFLKYIARAWTGELSSGTKVCQKPLYALKVEQVKVSVGRGP